MARVACIMMQKDEGELLRTWVEYHKNLFGAHNLFIFDNASRDQLTLDILQKYKDDGISINCRFTDLEAHVRKSSIFGDLIRVLDQARYFDFFIPIDCDEFFVLRNGLGSVTADTSLIHAELDSLMEHDQALGIDRAYYNILSQPDHFFDWPHRKTFFRAGTFESMDSGFHEGKSSKAEGKFETRFAHVHYHHKPYKILVEHSKNKLRPFFDPDDEAQLNDPKNKNRLTDFITQGEAAYMHKFTTKKGMYLPQISHHLKLLGLMVPFSG